jgi:hypothetical protein
MDCAAENDHLNVVIWLHNNRTEGCSKNAIDCAALGRHQNIINYLKKINLNKQTKNNLN